MYSEEEKLNASWNNAADEDDSANLNEEEGENSDFDLAEDTDLEDTELDEDFSGEIKE